MNFFDLKKIYWRWSVESVHTKNIVSILHLLVALARHFRSYAPRPPHSKWMIEWLFYISLIFYLCFIFCFVLRSEVNEYIVVFYKPKMLLFECYMASSLINMLRSILNFKKLVFSQGPDKITGECCCWCCNRHQEGGSSNSQVSLG